MTIFGAQLAHPWYLLCALLAAALAELLDVVQVAQHLVVAQAEQEGGDQNARGAEEARGELLAFLDARLVSGAELMLGALERAGLRLADIDLIELNEAFAAQVLACLREWKVDPEDERLNPNGSGISLGHPVGATGARILATLAHEMQRRGSRYGLETMCIGGGQGLAAVFEAVR